MKAPISWLKDFVEIDIAPELLADKLVSIGFEVEEIIDQSKNATNVVVSKILEIEKHPNADKLSVCKVGLADREIQIVTNAKMTVGELVPVALDGAVLATGQPIKAGKLRGVHSDGMFCGGEELGLTDSEYEGASANDVLRLKGDLKVGENIFKAIGYDDVILDIDVTANRPDCNSIFGLAKEVAVATEKNWDFPNYKFKTCGGNVENDIKVDVQNQELCPRYMAGSVKNVKVSESSSLVQKRLRSVGIRPINNIVDITNYILIELGQPMHAFDKRDLDGDTIVVRNAVKNEKIVSLDGKENKLTEDMLVICDSKKPVAIAGIMGGENSGVKDDTKDIVFESARFARDSVRRTSRKLNLRSDSSSRFEKGVDFALQENALKRAFALISESNAGDIQDGIIDVAVEYEKSKKVEFTMRKISDILGFEISKKQIVPILTRLGITVKENGENLIAEIPGEREDIVGANDIAEEFIRVFGYDHIPTTYFVNEQATKGGRDEKIIFVDNIKETLASLGLFEAVNYSFTSPKCFDLLNFDSEDSKRKVIKILNPLGEAVSIMRTTLVHSMLETLKSNISKFNKEARLFEIGKTYMPKSLPLKELPKEEEMLCLGLYGDEDFFSLKAVLQAMFEKYGYNFELAKTKVCYLHDGRSAEIKANGKVVGVCGEIHPDVMENYDIDERIYVAEISIDKMFAAYKNKIKFKEISKFPPVQRDLAVVVDENVVAGDLKKAVLSKHINLLNSVEIFDIFRSEQIGENKKSVALNFEFVSYDKTMNENQITECMNSVLKVLKKKFGAELR